MATCDKYTIVERIQSIVDDIRDCIKFVDYAGKKASNVLYSFTINDQRLIVEYNGYDGELTINHDGEAYYFWNDKISGNLHMDMPAPGFDVGKTNIIDHDIEELEKVLNYLQSAKVYFSKTFPGYF